MKNPTIEFLEQREAAIIEQVNALQDELHMIHAAKIARKQETNIRVAHIDSIRLTMRPSKRPTIMGMIKSVLAGSSNGMEYSAIISAVRQKYNVEIPRSSMSPQLSRLKAYGELKLKDKKWRLTNVTNAE